MHVKVEGPLNDVETHLKTFRPTKNTKHMSLFPADWIPVHQSRNQTPNNALGTKELGCKGSCPQTVRFSGLLARTFIYKCLGFSQAAYQVSGSISWRSNPSWPQASKVGFWLNSKWHRLCQVKDKVLAAAFFNTDRSCKIKNMMCIWI